MLISLLLPSFTALADDMDYHISQYEVTIDVQSNGDAMVKERITYDFSGSFNGILRDIDIDKTDGIDGLKVFVEEENGSREFQQSGGEGENSYELTQDGDLTKLKVYEKSKNEEKTFVYEYTLLNVAEKYKDIGVFSRKVIDSNWDVPLNNIHIIINIPKGANKEDLKVFAHGPLTGVSEIVDGQTFSFELPELMPGTFVETLAIFPPELIGHSQRVYEETKLPSILENEQKEADKANAEREEARKEEDERRKELEKEAIRKEKLKRIRNTATPAFIAVILYGIYSFIDFMVKYTRKLKPEFQGDYYRELPEDYTPAIMNYLLSNKNVESKEIMATIMDLVRKKKIAIRRIEKEKGWIIKKTHEQYEISKIDGVGLDDLYPHETFLISWFIDKLGTDGRLVIDDLKNILKKESKALEFDKNYNTFKSKVKNEGKKKGFFIKNDIKGSKKYGFTGIALALVGILLARYLESGLGVLISGIGFITLISMFIVSVMEKKTRYGTEQTAMWRAFKKFLLDFSNMDKAEIPSIIIWEHYLAYAISLGVAKEVIDQLPKVFSESELMDPGLTYMGGYRSLNNLILMNTMLTNTAKSIDNAVSTASIAASPDSSGSGMGGGFSGGSSGGGGGGGGGGAF